MSLARADVERPDAISEIPGEPKHPIRPDDIRVSESGAAGRFGKFEVELSAGKLIQFFQARGWWISFSITELTAFYQKKGWDPNLMFFGLAGLWWSNSPLLGGWNKSWPCIAIDSDGRCNVTDVFIERCAKGGQ